MRIERTRTIQAAISLDEAKAQARVLHAHDDAWFTDAILAATLDFEDAASVALHPQTVTVHLDCWPTHTLALPIGPTASNVTVSVDGLPYTAFTLGDGRNPVLTVDDLPTGPVVITYTTGFSEVPADIQLAIADQVARHFDFRGRDGIEFFSDIRTNMSRSPAFNRAVGQHRRLKVG